MAVDSRAADWVQGELNALHRMKPKLGPAPVLRDFSRRAIALLACAMNTGVYNLPIRWDRVDWRAGHGVRFTMRATTGLSTWDFDHLTRLVLLAHEESIRINLVPATIGYFYIWMHPRSREGAMHDRHPTIQQAIDRLAGGRP